VVIAKSKKTSAREFVFDGSVALAWCFPDESDSYSQNVLESLDRAAAWAPSHWPLEVANALVMGERRKRSTEADTLRWLGFVAALPIAVDDETVGQCWSNTISIARQHHSTVYDAAYVELALRRGLSIATLDRKMKVAGVMAYRV
jgi:predicted nucleic acid-binding protein